MPTHFETITARWLEHVIGGAGAYTAAATSSQNLQQQTQKVSYQNAPGSGGYASRVRGGGSGQ